LDPAVERYLLRVIIAHPAYLEVAAEADIGPMTFQDARYREIFETLSRLGADAEPQVVAAALSGAAVGAYDAILGEPPESIVDLERTFRETLAKLRVRELRARNEELRRLISAARNSEESNGLLAQLDANKKYMQRLLSGT
jgi:hypothetical protein